ncbi:hypothetical protein QR685DRAFT_538845 [Neurospora intermedia]|uniref:Secreted protein n=1 Tax=Neurospora intermedia TaxID=5142 RepID=A0ABR3CXP0_NEUIN
MGALLPQCYLLAWCFILVTLPNQWLSLAPRLRTTLLLSPTATIHSCSAICHPIRAQIRYQPYPIVVTNGFLFWSMPM